MSAITLAIFHYVFTYSSLWKALLNFNIPYLKMNKLHIIYFLRKVLSHCLKVTFCLNCVGHYMNWIFKSLYWHYSSFFFFLPSTYFSPRWGLPAILNFCMPLKVAKKSRNYARIQSVAPCKYTYKMLESKVLDYNMFLKSKFGRRPQHFKIGGFLKKTVLGQLGHIY